MRVLVCPDKFKGSLTASEVCQAIHNGLIRFDSDIETIMLPLADGGEGTLDVLESVLETERVELIANNPLMRPFSTYYLQSKDLAFIEMANASGLQLLKNHERNPLSTTTFGTGEMIRHALDRGVNHIYLLIGGSATNDGGIGMAKALGYDFEVSDENFKADGAGLPFIEGLVKDDIHSRIEEVKFTVLSDVRTKLLGKDGASYTYGRQKGADDKAIDQLDQGLTNLSIVLNNGFENVPGSGAAGGLGYGAMSFLKAEIKSGIETILDIVGFHKNVESVDLIITGEGKLDAQTAEGKVISGVLHQANTYNIPIGIICGLADLRMSGIDPKSIYQVTDLALNHSDAMTNAGKYVEDLAFNLISDIR